MVQLMHMEMVAVMLYDGDGGAHDDGFRAMRFIMPMMVMT